VMNASEIDLMMITIVSKRCTELITMVLLQ
jgi:hypothetical protein